MSCRTIKGEEEQGDAREFLGEPAESGVDDIMSPAGRPGVRPRPIRPDEA
jgi:hypothetical protein